MERKLATATAQVCKIMNSLGHSGKLDSISIGKDLPDNALKLDCILIGRDLPDIALKSKYLLTSLQFLNQRKVLTSFLMVGVYDRILGRSKLETIFSSPLFQKCNEA